VRTFDEPNLHVNHQQGRVDVHFPIIVLVQNLKGRRLSRLTLRVTRGRGIYAVRMRSTRTGPARRVHSDVIRCANGWRRHGRKHHLTAAARWRRPDRPTPSSHESASREGQWATQRVTFAS
jgi:hypothetical protein